MKLQIYEVPRYLSQNYINSLKHDKNSSWWRKNMAADGGAVVPYKIKMSLTYVNNINHKTIPPPPPHNII